MCYGYCGFEGAIIFDFSRIDIFRTPCPVALNIELCQVTRSARNSFACINQTAPKWFEFSYICIEMASKSIHPLMLLAP